MPSEVQFAREVDALAGEIFDGMIGKYESFSFIEFATYKESKRHFRETMRPKKVV